MSDNVNKSRERKVYYMDRLPKIFFWYNLIRVFFLLKKLKPDIIHFHYIAGISWVAAFLKRYSFILTVWGGDVLPEQDAFKRPFSRQIITTCLKKARFVTVHSAFLKKRMIQMGVEEERIKFISFGVDLKIFKKTPLVPSHFRYLKKKKVILSIRIPCKAYNIDRIIESFRIVSQKVPDSILLIKKYLSDRTYLRYLDGLIDRLDLRKKVIYIEEMRYKELPLLYSVSDIVVSIPYSDGFPISILESMACSTVPVIGDLKEYKDDLTDGVNAFFTNINDIHDIAEKIIYGLNRRARNKVIQNNLKYVKKHDYRKNMEEMEKLYYEFSKR